MSDFDSLREDMAGTPMEPLLGIFGALETMQATDANLGRWAREISDEVVKLWDDRAALRDELHALANRVESLTRARLTEPAEVAERMTQIHDARMERKR